MGGASRSPCTTYASGQPLLYKASRLFTAFVLKVQKLGEVFSCPELGPWGGWGRGFYAHMDYYTSLSAPESPWVQLLFIFLYILHFPLLVHPTLQSKS